MRSQTWTPSHLPPHNISLGHPHAPAPSMLHPTSDMDWRFNSYMTVYMLEFPFYQIIPPSPSPFESKSPLYTSVSPLLSRIQGHHCHLSKFHIHVFPILNTPPSPSLSHPSGSSQCTSPEHPVSCIETGLAILFTNENIRVSMPFSQIIPPSPSPTESKRQFCTSVSLLLSHIQGYCYHLSKFHIYVWVYCIGVFLSGLLHSVQPSFKSKGLDLLYSTGNSAQC